MIKTLVGCKSMDEAVAFVDEQSRGNHFFQAPIGALRFQVGATPQEDRVLLDGMTEAGAQVSRPLAIGPTALQQICADVKVPYNFFVMNEPDLRKAMMERWIRNNGKKKRTFQMAARYEKVEKDKDPVLVEEPCIRAVVSPAHRQASNLQFLQILSALTSSAPVEWKIQGGNNIYSPSLDVIALRQLTLPLEKSSDMYMAVMFRFSEMGLPLISDYGLYRVLCTNQIRFRLSGLNSPARRVSYSKLDLDAEIETVKSFALNVREMYGSVSDKVLSIGEEGLSEVALKSLVDGFVEQKKLSRKLATELMLSVTGGIEEEGQKFSISNRYDLACCLAAKARTLKSDSRATAEALAGYILFSKN